MQQPPEGHEWPPQQPYYPPGPQYPQQQPYYPPPGQPPKKKRRTWLWIVLGVLAIVVLGCVGVVALASQASKTVTTGTISTTTTGNTPTTKASTPAGQQKWTTVRTFTGNGSKKTAIFHVPNDWKIVWKCDPASFTGGQYNMIVTIYNSDNTPSDVPINTICKAGNTSDSTEIHMSGDIYLDVVSEGSWTVQVQEVK